MSSPTPAQFDRITHVYDQAGAAKQYAETLIFEMQEIEDDDYCMVWTTEQAGDFPPAD